MIDVTHYPCPASPAGLTHHLLPEEGWMVCAYCNHTRDDIERSIEEMTEPISAPLVPDKDELLTTEEVAEMLKVDPNTLYRWRVAHTMLPFYPLGSSVRPIIRYRRSDILAFLGEARVDVSPDHEPDDGPDNEQNPPAEG